ncbi:MAG TPA: glycosyltransferase, partial [Rhizomicrobium sp.]|nr:glycosyltransferase [Rhizomicrobium sp.]
MCSVLTRVASASERKPLIVTLTRTPVSPALGHIFGQEWSSNLVLAKTGELKAFAFAKANGLTGALDIRSTPALIDSLHAGGFQLFLRFTDPSVYVEVLEREPALIELASALITQFRTETDWEKMRMTAAARGFVQSCNTTTPQGAPVDIFIRKSGGDVQLALPINSNPPIRRLVLVDNNLTGERGHFLSLAQTISDGAAKMGAEIVWGANERLKDSDVPRNVIMERCFHTSLFDLCPEEQKTRDLSDEIAAGWERLFEKYDGPHTHFLLHSADGHQIRAAHKLLDKRAEREGVVHVCTPHHPTQMPSRNIAREIDRYIVLLTKLEDFGERVFLWTETQALASLYSQRFGAPVSALRLPAPAWAREVKIDAARKRPVIGYFGIARGDKGFLELPGIFRAALAQCKGIEAPEFIVHAAPTPTVRPGVAEAMAELAEIPSVKLYPKFLSETEYRELFMRVDAVMLPYERRLYATRGSGVLIETLASGKIALVSAGTALAEYQAEGEMMVCDTEADWAAAIRTVAARRLELLESARLLGTRFRQSHSPAAYVAQFASEIDAPVYDEGLLFNQGKGRSGSG